MIKKEGSKIPKQPEPAVQEEVVEINGRKIRVKTLPPSPVKRPRGGGGTQGTWGDLAALVDKD